MRRRDEWPPDYVCLSRACFGEGRCHRTPLLPAAAHPRTNPPGEEHRHPNQHCGTERESVNPKAMPIVLNPLMAQLAAGILAAEDRYKSSRPQLSVIRDADDAPDSARLAFST